MWMLRDSLKNVNSLQVLIDTWWNVNVYVVPAMESGAEGINRYMVECEFICTICIRWHTFVLIDTWWNVNLTTLHLLVEPEQVLIDTWWNVNVPSTTISVDTLSVLIDTWWNVNKSVRQQVYDSLNVLIDTWWNVNVEQFTQYRVEDLVLIDTWWNVNWALRVSENSWKHCINRYMVECELKNVFSDGNIGAVLIDTWWNVNGGTALEVSKRKGY